jgi:C4-type Zn-finger protein
MICPSCDAVMNLHAEKSVKDADVPEGELIARVYYCPHCGKVEAEMKNM